MNCSLKIGLSHYPFHTHVKYPHLETNTPSGHLIYLIPMSDTLFIPMLNTQCELEKFLKSILKTINQLLCTHLCVKLMKLGDTHNHLVCRMVMESKRQGVVEEGNSEAIEELDILGLRETFVWTIGFDCFIKWVQLNRINIGYTDENAKCLFNSEGEREFLQQGSISYKMKRQLGKSFPGQYFAPQARNLEMKVSD